MGLLEKARRQPGIAQQQTAPGGAVAFGGGKQQPSGIAPRLSRLSGRVDPLPSLDRAKLRSALKSMDKADSVIGLRIERDELVAAKAHSSLTVEETCAELAVALENALGETSLSFDSSGHLFLVAAASYPWDPEMMVTQLARSLRLALPLLPSLAKVHIDAARFSAHDSPIDAAIISFAHGK
ncbi:MAG: hypothetical protein WCQ50_20655 [Spirochaetota bacterium]